MLPSEPNPYKDNALELTNRLRECINDGKLPDALKNLDSLKSMLKDWHRATGAGDAREWLETAFQEDMLLFNSELARKHLKNWRDALDQDDDPELNHYRGLVEERIRQKNKALQIQGVIAHCEALLTKAAELERGDTPPHPDFLMSNYYTKARDIIRAARAEHDANAELDMLLTKAERLYVAKSNAMRIYTLCFEQDAYGDALRELNRLASDSYVPRFIVDSIQDDGQRTIIFHSMVSSGEARRELLSLAQDWAQQRTNTMLQEAQRLLDTHHPQAAVDVFNDRAVFQSYLKDDLRKSLDTLQETAKTALNNYTQAGDRARRALQAAVLNPLEGWEGANEAARLYQAHPQVTEAREAALAALRAQLEGLITKAEEAFDARQMDHVRQIHQSARRIYGEKDPSLDLLLDRLLELDEMTRRYEEYLRSANETYRRIKALLYEDAVTTNELLSQLESYPELILVSFPDLPDLRQRVNRRLNADHLYTQLYNRLFSDDVGIVAEGIHLAENAVEEFIDDKPRFQALVRSMRLHSDFLDAQQHQETGQHQKALDLLAPVAAHADHPDREAALRLITRLRADSQNPPT
jgi:predicted ester cyclase